MQFFSIILVAASALLVAASSIQPSASDIKSTPITSRRSSRHERVTNAMRLRRGLTPLRPRVIPRTGTPTVREEIHIAARASASPSASSSPGNPSSPSVTGIIKLTNKGDGSVLGYLSQDYQIYGEYGVTSDNSSALQVGIGRLSSGLNGPLNLKGLNGADDTYPYIGAVSGYADTSDNLASGSITYKYIGGVDATSAYSGPVQENASAFSKATGIQKASESSIWYVNTYTKAITASWINGSGKAGPTEILYYMADNVLVLSGDSDAFVAEFGDAIPISFSFEELA